MKPQLNPGEVYVGRINDEYVILLPGDSDNANHEAQREWAKSIGGDLPTRIEQAMLWDRYRDQFENDWYWSCEYNEAGSAWVQNFLDGGQGYSYSGIKSRARAVRRVKVEDIK